jgi:hypothetical protein
MPPITFAEWARFAITKYLRDARRHTARAKVCLDNWRRIAGRES